MYVYVGALCDRIRCAEFNNIRKERSSYMIYSLCIWLSSSSNLATLWNKICSQKCFGNFLVIEFIVYVIFTIFVFLRAEQEGS